MACYLTITIVQCCLQGKSFVTDIDTYKSKYMYMVYNIFYSKKFMAMHLDNTDRPLTR